VTGIHFDHQIALREERWQSVGFEFIETSRRHIIPLSPLHLTTASATAGSTTVSDVTRDRQVRSISSANGRGSGHTEYFLDLWVAALGTLDWFAG